MKILQFHSTYSTFVFINSTNTNNYGGDDVNYDDVMTIATTTMMMMVMIMYHYFVSWK